MTTFRVKRVQDTPQESDGHRLLVDRLWPRGISKERARIDAWPKDVTPSTELRKSFHADKIDEDESAERYRSELEQSGAADELAKDLPAVVTLVTAVKEPGRGQLPVLLKVLRAAA